MVRVLDPAEPEVVNSVIKRFMDDENAMHSLDPEDTDLKPIVARSGFKRTPVRQLSKAFEESHGVYTPTSKAHIGKRFKRMSNTDCAEQSFNHMKNSRVKRGARKRRGPHRSCAILLKQRILETRNKYREVKAYKSQKITSEKPPESFFAANPDCKFDWKGCIGTTSKAPHWSPGANDLHTPPCRRPHGQGRGSADADQPLGPPVVGCAV